MPEIASRRHLELVVPVIEEALGEHTLDDVDTRRGHAGPGPDRRAARRALGGEGAGLGPRPAARAGQPPARPRRLALPRAGAARAAVSLPARERRATRCSSTCPSTAPSGRSGRRSTTRPARRSTRAPGCSGSATPAAPRSTGSRARAIPRRSTSRSRACPGLDFSFSGVKTALLYEVRGLGDAGRGAAGRSRRELPAGDRARARRADARGRRADRGRAGRRRRRRGRELRAPRGASRTPRRRRSRSAPTTPR